MEIRRNVLQTGVLSARSFRMCFDFHTNGNFNRTMFYDLLPNDMSCQEYDSQIRHTVHMDIPVFITNAVVILFQSSAFGKK